MIRSGGPRRVITLVAVVATVVALAGATPAAPNGGRPVGPGFQGESGIPKDLDLRTGRLQPTSAQERAVAALDAAVRWNRFGTPQSLIRYGGYLATGLSSDPIDAALGFLRDNHALFRLGGSAIRSLEVVRVAPIGRGHSVLLRQRLGGLDAAAGGTAAVGVVEGKVAYVSSSLVGSDAAPRAPLLSLERAVAIAAADVGRRIDTDDIVSSRRVDGWTRLNTRGSAEQLSGRLVAVPTPLAGNRSAYQTFLLDADAAEAFTHFIDARTGAVLIRLNEVDHVGEPKWDVFPAYPELSYSSADTRETWCWDPGPGCDRVIAKDALATPFPWDVRPAVGEKVTETSLGNNAHSFEKWNTNDPFRVGKNPAATRPGRNYQYAWTNQWLEERCDPAVFDSAQRNDIDAAIANLFVGHNRMHDWAYRLGFTEATFNLQEHNFGRGGDDNDPEMGNAQAGGVVGGPPAFLSRDNANQITPPDGREPITNMYLWQPIAAAFYAPCVDGDFDMTVIGHEYTHAISNRMVAGPDERLQGLQANAMGESWSDLMAMEILNEYGFVPVAGESPYVIGAYVTGDPVAGIRNYNMSASPLNYSDVGYDIVGPQVHADGEIWSATNFDIRRALIAEYGSADQVACADGLKPATQCPGNRRWAQIVFDAWLLMSVGAVDMLDARDAMLAADVMRFEGANQDLLWNAFAARGLGESAVSASSDDHQPVPGFDSPFADEATVTFAPVAEDGTPINAQLFVGHYEARTTPVADTDPGTALDDVFAVVPGTYDLVVRANGYGSHRSSLAVGAGETRTLPVVLGRNVASGTNGATAAGDGINLSRLIDDTESTNWASLGSPVVGKKVTVRLDPSRPNWVVDEVQVSAMLRPPIPSDPGGDTGGQNRFSALRQFRILVCRARGNIDCTQDSQFTAIFTSPADAFPSVVPRPRAPDLTLRSFDVPNTAATHVRIVVLSNQCTGTPAFRGDQDDDPANVTDCVAGSTQDLNVRIAELQVFPRM
jgi:extracellular elastinolytic metalloproteinase